MKVCSSIIKCVNVINETFLRMKSSAMEIPEVLKEDWQSISDSQSSRALIKILLLLKELVLNKINFTY